MQLPEGKSLIRVGSMFAGIGGAELAVAAVLPQAHPVWQLDLHNADVRARHWPDAVQITDDVRHVDPAALKRVDIVTAGFPCQDLSTAGNQAGLDGARSGLYSEVLRFAKALRPRFVLMENVNALLKYMPRLCADWRALGYGLTWTVCEAADAGFPHLRRRVFVLAELGRAGRGLVAVDTALRWGQLGAVRNWPTVTVCGNDNYKGASATAGDGLASAVRFWATPLASEAKGARTSKARRENPDLLSEQIRPWPTPLGADAQAVKNHGKPNAPSLNYEATQYGVTPGLRLNPDWVETLMGLPPGWTLPSGPAQRFDFWAPAPRGRYPASWDRALPWPGYAWEPPRTLPDGPPLPGRPARLRAIGNAWCPQQGALALRALLPRSF